MKKAGKIVRKRALANAAIPGHKFSRATGNYTPKCSATTRKGPFKEVTHCQRTKGHTGSHKSGQIVWG